MEWGLEPRNVQQETFSKAYNMKISERQRHVTSVPYNLLTQALPAPWIMGTRLIFLDDAAISRDSISETGPFLQNLGEMS